VGQILSGRRRQALQVVAELRVIQFQQIGFVVTVTAIVLSDAN
jgi:hypothetical protein